MPNGGTIYAGRTVAQLSAGRPVAALTASPTNGAWINPPRAAMCAGVQQCCCKGPWNIGPGETLPLALDWSPWLASVPGFNLSEVAEASITDMTVNPPAAPEAEIIKLVLSRNDDEPDNTDVADLIRIFPPSATIANVAVGLDARIGAQFRLDMAMTAKDCAGESITMRDCFVIVVREC